MKKYLFLTLFFSALFSTSLFAQNGSDPAALLHQMKEKFKAPMVEKTGLTEAQADRVIEINFEIRQAASGLRDLSEADRAVKIAEFKALKEKKYSEIPLTPEQIKSVYAFFEETGRAMQKKSGS